ncbi:kinesin [Trypanosoma rangeli]|uniref:Kinesin n=1 Tax=Trypanosoma rangeli TaxID=5698 RepID=A0A3R7KUL5_TRYRA|nr:kinesin [Trypanosoma rangeli]RNF10038.1 kinesin [Trypanosoma rangeli]|eukprot:RNF10038.1 kinesin [Trypanosoma rangeli]
MSAERAIGSTITLITNSLIRYEGTLGQIDGPNNTVSLTNVRVFGTEGRGEEAGLAQIPPADQLFDQIVFRGSDIKELTVFEEPHNAMMDPAIVTALPARNPPSKMTSTQQRSGPSAGHAHPQQQQQQQQHHHHQPHHQQQRYGGGGYRRGGGGSGYRGARRADGHTGQDFRPATGAAKEEFKDDFDFTKSREEFEKKKNEFEKAKEDAKTHSKVYDRSSFFDKISCDQQDRIVRLDREGMKRADAETFGSEMVGNMRGPRRGRGGRGRYNGRYN